MKSVINLFIYILFISLEIALNISYKTPVNSYNGEKNEEYFKLVIPNIDLSVNVYDFNSEKNNVDSGVELINDYYFNNEKGALILASHSGKSKISYFKNLHHLANNDIIEINHNGYTYIYKVFKKYKIKKNGKLKYNNQNGYLYLVTCDKKNNKKQLVILSKREKIVKNSDFW